MSDVCVFAGTEWRWRVCDSEGNWSSDCHRRPGTTTQASPPWATHRHRSIPCTSGVQFLILIIVKRLVVFKYYTLVHWNISNGRSKLNCTIVRLTVTDSWPHALMILPGELLLVRYQLYNNNNNNNKYYYTHYVSFSTLTLLVRRGVLILCL